jgi:hypothetical protein
MNDVPYSPRHAEAVLPVSLRTVTPRGEQLGALNISLVDLSPLLKVLEEDCGTMNNKKTILSKQFEELATV